MPVCDGLEATRLIRSEESADPSRRRIPIVAVTANASKEVEVDCMKAGMEGCMCARLSAPSPVRAEARLCFGLAWLSFGRFCAVSFVGALPAAGAARAVCAIPDA